MSSTPNLSIHGNQKTWILTCTMEVQTSPWPTYMAMAWGCTWAFRAIIVRSWLWGWMPPVYSSIVIPPEFRYRFPMCTTGYLSASRLSGHRIPSAAKTILWFVFWNFFRTSSGPPANITSKLFQKKKSFRLHGSEFKHTMKKKIPKKKRI